MGQPRERLLIDPPVDRIPGLGDRIEIRCRIPGEIVVTKHRNIELSAQYRQQALFRERAEPDEDASQPAAIPLLEGNRAGNIVIADQTRLDQQLTDRSDGAKLLTNQQRRRGFRGRPVCRVLGDSDLSLPGINLH